MTQGEYRWNVTILAPSNAVKFGVPVTIACKESKISVVRSRNGGIMDPAVASQFFFLRQSRSRRHNSPVVSASVGSVHGSAWLPLPIPHAVRLELMGIGALGHAKHTITCIPIPFLVSSHLHTQLNLLDVVSQLEQESQTNGPIRYLLPLKP
jgi:hypothetical protein